MKTDEIELLYNYNDWADARFLAACTRVSSEQYATPTDLGTGYAGLRATMVHMLDNIWQWRITLQGFYKEPLADDAAYDATMTPPNFMKMRSRRSPPSRNVG